jgi:spermidine synthase
MLGDADKVIRQPEWQGAIDALQVDLYDHEAAAPVLDDADFYRACHAVLAPGGCMTVNLFGRASSFERSVQQMAAAFGLDALWAFRPTREGNTVVLAQRAPSRPPRAELAARAIRIEEHTGLPANKWLRVFKPLQA